MISAETENTPTMTSFPLVLLTVGSSPVLEIKSENRSSSKHSFRWKTYHIVWRASRLITTKSYGLILDLWQHQFAIRFAVTFAINALFIWVTPRSILNITFAKKGTFIWICKKTLFTPLEVMNLYTHVNALLWSWEYTNYYTVHDAYQKKAGFCGTFDVDIPLSSLYKHICLYGNHWGLECSWWEVSLPCICWNQRPPSFIEAKEGGNESSLFSILLSQAHVRLHIHTWLM